MMELYTAPTPNGLKIPIALEELGLHYRLHLVDLSRGGAAVPGLREINPNAKIPVLVEGLYDGRSATIFESGAILLYLADKRPGLIPTDQVARAATLSWLFLQVAGLGPSFGNTAYFRRTTNLANEALVRFQGEALRHMSLVESRLAQVPWLNGVSYSIADIAHFCWVRSCEYAGIRIEDFPAAEAWVERIEKRDATRAALERCHRKQTG